MSQPEESQGKTSKTDSVLRARPPAPALGAHVVGGPEPISAEARAREIAHADELAEEAEASSQEVS
jgi:hypothetical protein